MNRLSMLLLVQSLLLFLTVVPSVPVSYFVQESSVYQRCRVIGGQEFCHTVRSHQGTITEEFLCNSVPLEQDEYQKKLDQAYLKQLRNDDQLKAEKEKQRLLWQQDISAKVVEKIAVQNLEKIKTLTASLHQDILTKYLVFVEHSLIAGHGQLAEVARSVPIWHQQITSLLKEHRLSDLQQLSQHLEKVTANLESMFALTMQNAIARCDDTQILKQLLDLCGQ